MGGQVLGGLRGGQGGFCLGGGSGRVGGGGHNHHFHCNGISVIQVCTMGWCRYVQITWAISCGAAVSHGDSNGSWRQILTSCIRPLGWKTVQLEGFKALIQPYWTLP